MPARSETPTSRRLSTSWGFVQLFRRTGQTIGTLSLNKVVPLYPWHEKHHWPNAYAALVPLLVADKAAEGRIRSYRMILQSHGNDLPDLGRCLDLFAWLARFIDMDGPIGIYFSPDLPDSPPTVLSVYSRQLFYMRASGERIPFRNADAGETKCGVT